MTSLLDDNTLIQVSSVLHNDNANNGPQNMTDGDPDTAWYSGDDRPYHIMIHFHRQVHIHAITMAFVDNWGAMACMAIIPSVKGWTMRPTKDSTKPQTFVAPDSVKAASLDFLSLIIHKGSGYFENQVAISFLDVIGVEAQPAQPVPQPAE
ncbi:hypothetical protein AMAG_08506 [Allomyces macrogynus ATCC 38327]|uniref:Uncharacterized protein n=1 Tax=Allomyces macrogynus (strain ATCC 38327) TaxID=578462 RepID=A0A0L0SLU0_ALLM3|nr:hypothetical protein AMAG_08506 [Allomyces macrogynus ATCC 38327]|eukprot:KNE63369.1 hypothetical protein AMAG_08506 [Allomyces macrogynus ATCC 38327]